ncbi:MAG: hypothetical protein HQL97_04455 [Magnetococcales bacterium]|nr:hypothetical protein [Magnetococcales bacterium]
MMVNMELWQLISLLLAFFGFTAGGVKIFLNQFERRLDERFSSLGTAMATMDQARRESAEELARHDQTVDGQLREFMQDTDRQLRELERGLHGMQVEMLSKYVQREDYIRGQTVLEAKLDALYSKLETILARGNTNER